MLGEVFKGNHNVRPDWFRCRSCGTQHVDCPMLQHHVWEQVRTMCPIGDAKRDLLCISCVEKYLGRDVMPGDLLPSLGNAYAFLLDERHAAMAEHDALAVLIGAPEGDTSVLERIARACYRATSEDVAVANIRTIVRGIMEE